MGNLEEEGFALDRYLVYNSWMRKTPPLSILLLFSSLLPLWAGLDAELSGRLPAKSAQAPQNVHTHNQTPRPVRMAPMSLLKAY